MKRVISVILLSMLFISACGDKNNIEQAAVSKEKKVTWNVEMIGDPLSTKSYNSDFDSESIIGIDANNEEEVKCSTLCITLKREKTKALKKLDENEHPTDKWFDKNIRCYSRIGNEWITSGDEPNFELKNDFDNIFCGYDYNDQFQYYGLKADYLDDESKTERYDFYTKTKNELNLDKSFSFTGKIEDGKFPLVIKRISENVVMAICYDGYVRQFDLIENKVISENDCGIKNSICALGEDCIAIYDSAMGGVRIIDASSCIDENLIKLDEKIDENKIQAKVAIVDDEVYFLTLNGLYVANIKDKQFEKQDCSYNLDSVLSYNDYNENACFSCFSAYEGRVYICIQVLKESLEWDNFIYSFKRAQ